MKPLHGVQLDAIRPDDWNGRKAPFQAVHVYIMTIKTTRTAPRLIGEARENVRRAASATPFIPLFRKETHENRDDNERIYSRVST